MIHTLIIFPDELRAGDTLIDSYGIRHTILERYRPDFRNNEVCVAFSVEGSEQIDNHYYRLTKTVKVERSAT